MKTGFVTLLMIGIAAAQMPIYTITPGEKPACIVIDTSKAGWHFDFCHLFVTELPPKPGTMIYTLPAEIPATVPKPAKPPAKKAAPKCSGCGTVTDLGPCTADWCTQAVTPITQQGAPDLSQMKPVIKMCSGLTGECDPTALDGLNTFNACRDQKWIGMAKWRGKDVRCAELGDAVKASDLADMIPDTAPLDVPAIRKSVKDEPNCSTSMLAGGADDGWTNGHMGNFPRCGPTPTYHDEWNCTDKSRFLLTSEDGKKHCLKF